ncbi:MAG: AMP-binding protein [Paludibacteraceae bacterium]|nr:AMP-binding protein [Paludibacteraceae bacterium]
MTKNYLDILAETIRNNWDQPALTDFYLTEDGKSQDTSRGNHYTYGEMYEKIVHVADFLTNLGLQKGDHIAICGANSAHWVIAYLAIAKMQGVSVTIMHSLQPDQIAQLIDFSDAKALFVDAELWMELKEKSLPQVKNVIGLEEWGILRGEKVKIPNRKSQIENHECGWPVFEPNTLAHICFTSGTTGKAKGAMLSFENISSTTWCVKAAYPIRKNKKILSYFPLAHAFGLGLEIVVPLVSGASIFVYRDELRIEKIPKAMRIVKPYLAVMVPMMLSKIAEGSILKLLLLRLLGINYIVVGGAGVPARIGKFMKRMHIPIAPGYGMTETVALISLITPDTYRVGASGKVCDALECRIAPNGEILVKGENVMLGYYKDPEATAAKIDKDGWLHTGDKGHLDEDGYLYVEGRLEQDIIVLPNGENIRPDNIEAFINAMPEVRESIVLAREGKLVAIVVPDLKIINLKFEIINIGELRRNILRAINPQLPLFSQLYDVEITDEPLQRTEKQTIKRYLYS